MLELLADPAGYSTEQFLTKMAELVDNERLYEDRVRPYLARETASGRLFLYASPLYAPKFFLLLFGLSNSCLYNILYFYLSL
jgi:hypothetical protein